VCLTGELDRGPRMLRRHRLPVPHSSLTKADCLKRKRTPRAVLGLPVARKAVWKQLPFPTAEETSRRGYGSRYGAGCLERFAVHADSVPLRINGGDAARGGEDYKKCQGVSAPWGFPTLSRR
jgi:hypothetical protein